MNIERKYSSQSRRARKRAAKWRLAQIIKIEQGCADCGYKDSAYALQFDHIGDNKKDCVSNLIGNDYSWKTILTEIRKCQVLCANCHAIKTKQRGQAYSKNSYLLSLS